MHDIDHYVNCVSVYTLYLALLHYSDAIFIIRLKVHVILKRVPGSIPTFSTTNVEYKLNVFYFVSV
jgi:hypothetical protein